MFCYDGSRPAWRERHCLHQHGTGRSKPIHQRSSFGNWGQKNVGYCLESVLDWSAFDGYVGCQPRSANAVQRMQMRNATSAVAYGTNGDYEVLCCYSDTSGVVLCCDSDILPSTSTAYSVGNDPHMEFETFSRVGCQSNGCQNVRAYVVVAFRLHVDSGI